MSSILNFLVKHNHWFLFILLEGISFVLIFAFNNYHSAAMFTSANSVAGNLYAAISDVEGYFSLKDENTALHEHNKALVEKVNAMQEELSAFRDSASLADNRYICEKSKEGYTFGTARAINNTVNRTDNFITIDKGSNDGISQDMGVFNEKGVIGIVYLASENFALVQSLLNSKSMLSCRVKGDNSFCTLKWQGNDIYHSHLIDLPRHGRYEKGDTIVTSGFSASFPANVPVGEIIELEDSDDGNFYKAKIRLFADFSKADKLFTAGNSNRKEQAELESSINKEE